MSRLTTFFAGRWGARKFFVLLLSVCCAPIWSVKYFINQDGSAHLQTSHLMLQLLRGDQETNALSTFNGAFTPNSSGHWLMVGLLNVASPRFVTKLLVTCTFGGFVAGLTWLRVRTSPGQGGVKTTMLLGASLAFNWLWLVGFYNFLIGVCCLFVAVGFVSSSLSRMNKWRSAILAALLLLSYFSHIIAFAILLGSTFVIRLSSRTPKMRRDIAYILAAVIPVLPLLFAYGSRSAERSSVTATWRSLHDLTSIKDWTTQLRSADPFIIVSRNAFPFVGRKLMIFATFTPLLWISFALLFLSVSTVKRRFPTVTTIRSSPRLPFFLLFIVMALTAIFAPDDFGTENGGVFRERILLCGLAFFVPLFRFTNSRWSRLAQTCLVLTVSFQAAALWEYALANSRETSEYFAAMNAIPLHDSLASISVVQDGSRFHSIPEGQRDTYLGLAGNHFVWDNYELGYNLFPVVMRREADRRFARDLASSNLYFDGEPSADFDKKLDTLSLTLSRSHQKIDTLVMWGQNSKVDAIVQEWFDTTAYFEQGRVRLLHRKGGEPPGGAPPSA